jgi:hypothetical protein
MSVEGAVRSKQRQQQAARSRVPKVSS